MNIKTVFQVLAASLLLSSTTLGFADDTSKVVIAYQTGVDPSKVAQADGLYEKQTAREIDWCKFESGAEVIAAVASGDVVGDKPF